METSHIHHTKPPIEDKKWENILRPKKFNDFPGQKKIKEQMKIFVEAAKKRKEPLDHVLFSGHPGLGKTTLASIIANELNAPYISISAPVLEKKGDLASLLTNIKPFSVLFIDEIHRLNHTVEEYLYSAMEDYALDIIMGEGMASQNIKIQLPPFTLIGATTRTGLLKAPFRDRFGIIQHLNFYDLNSLHQVVLRSAQLLKVNLSEEGAREVARRSRATPRVSNRLLRRIRDYAHVHNKEVVDKDFASYALTQLGINEYGFDLSDRKFLSLMHYQFSGGPVGLDTLCSVLSESRETVEEIYEPFLIREGLLQKTTRGRLLSKKGRKMASLEAPFSNMDMDMGTDTSAGTSTGLGYESDRLHLE